MKNFIFVILLFLGISATAQRQLPLNDGQILRQRLSELKLTHEQKLRIMAIIRRQRMQEYLNRKELESILTDQQKKKLREWKKETPKKKKDSTGSRKRFPGIIRKNE